ncbi:MAG TPA: hypothetical protein VK399_13515, partial [Longimicrobiaceae bacterium]|nr:hypothetical protein [Longimicrobiaceae bacterium]
RVRFLLADYGMDALEGSGFARPVADALPHEAVILGPRDLPSILTELTALVASRLEAPDGGPSVYLVLGGLQRARTLRREEGGYRRSDAPASPGDQLLAVLRDGPEVGVHVLAWADTMTSITGMLDRKALGEFGMRVALSMPDKESSELIGSPAAARLKPFRALLLDEERPEGMETFRPYERPSAEWLAGLGIRLRTREHV